MYFGMGHYIELFYEVLRTGGQRRMMKIYLCVWRVHMNKQALSTAILGRTNLTVTRLGFGAMEIRGSRIWGGRPVTEEQAKTILNEVLDVGINFMHNPFHADI